LQTRHCLLENRNKKKNGGGDKKRDRAGTKSSVTWRTVKKRGLEGKKRGKNRGIGDDIYHQGGKKKISGKGNKTRLSYKTEYIKARQDTKRSQGGHAQCPKQ